ncbi:MAG: SPFH domain-containing protein [Myxococcota bacterium]
MRAALLLVVLAVGCVPYSTAPNEVGVRVNKITGVDSRVHPPGGTYFFAPFITDWYTFNTRTVALEMTAKGTGDAEDVEFKTRDGNDVAVDVTVLYHIDPAKAVDILTKGARNDEELREVLIRPLARAIPRDALNGLTSEDIYTSKKFDAAREAVEKLNAVLATYGVVVESVNLGDHRFHGEYQKAINDKKVFDQEVNTNRSAAENAKREWEANLERTRGDVEQSIATERGAAEQSNLEADAYYYAKQKEAEAILAEKEARAKGIRKLKEAMSGTGGRTRIKMKIAEALRGKRIVVVPTSTGSGVSINKLDVNDLIQQSVTREASTP